MSPLHVKVAKLLANAKAARIRAAEAMRDGWVSLADKHAVHARRYWSQALKLDPAKTAPAWESES